MYFSGGRMPMKMKKKIVFLCLTAILIFVTGCNSISNVSVDKNIESTANEKSSSETNIEITDMAGRTVEVPKEIQTVYSTGQPGVVMLYTLCPDKLLGWCLAPAKEEQEYLAPEYLNLPVLGLMQGSNDTANKEEIMERAPDIILFMTNLKGDLVNDAIADANKLQDKMKIPVVVTDYALEKLPNTYQFLGSLLQEEKKANELGTYCKNVLNETKEISERIPEKEKITVYYAQGSKGLQTAPKGSNHSEVIDYVGGENIVTLEAQSEGRLTVNLEQLLQWNPKVIISSYSADHIGQNENGTDVSKIITNSAPTWKLIDAVKENRVYSTPCYPYNWLDMPPSVNRMIGILWLGNTLYPEYYSYDMEEKTKEFYQLFYHVELSEEQINYLLQN